MNARSARLFASILVDEPADRAAPAAAVREHRVTPVVTAAIRAATLTFMIASAAGCGGGHHGDTYARATDTQQQCCEHLAGDARTSCLAGIVRIEDAQVAHTSANQSTYGCVTDYFTCDAATGHATATSAQAQLECIQDLH